MKEEPKAVLSEIQKRLGSQSNKEDVAVWLVKNVINRDFDFIREVATEMNIKPSHASHIINTFGFVVQNNFKFTMDTIKDDSESFTKKFDSIFTNESSQEGGSMNSFESMMFLYGALSLLKMFVEYIKVKTQDTTDDNNGSPWYAEERVKEEIVNTIFSPINFFTTVKNKIGKKTITNSIQTLYDTYLKDFLTTHIGSISKLIAKHKISKVIQYFITYFKETFIGKSKIVHTQAFNLPSPAVESPASSSPQPAASSHLPIPSSYTQNEIFPAPLNSVSSTGSV